MNECAPTIGAYTVDAGMDFLQAEPDTIEGVGHLERNFQITTLGQIPIFKGKLLEVLQENRTSHRNEYEEAYKLYLQEVDIRFEEFVTDFKKNPLEAFYKKPSPPPNHLKSYDSIIRKLELTASQIISLSNNEFEAYVQDNWGWKNQFKSAVSCYTNFVK